MVKTLPAKAADTRAAGLIPESGRSPGGGYGNPLQYSCLRNSMDRGAWQATVHGVARAAHDVAAKPPPPFICLAVLGSNCGIQGLSLQRVGSSSLTRDQTQGPCIGSTES